MKNSHPLERIDFRAALRGSVGATKPAVEVARQPSIRHFLLAALGWRDARRAHSVSPAQSVARNCCHKCAWRCCLACGRRDSSPTGPRLRKEKKQNKTSPCAPLVMTSLVTTRVCSRAPNWHVPVICIEPFSAIQFERYPNQCFGLLTSRWISVEQGLYL